MTRTTIDIVRALLRAEWSHADIIGMAGITHEQLKEIISGHC